MRGVIGGALAASIIAATMIIATCFPGTLFHDADGPIVIRIAKEGIVSVAASPDGKTVATSSFDSSIRLWHVKSGLPKAVVAGDGPGCQVVFSSDNRNLIAGSLAGRIILWNMADFKKLATANAHARPIASLCVAPKAPLIASGSLDGTIRLWDYVSTQFVATLDEENGSVESVAFSPCGSLVAAGSYKRVALCDAKTLKKRMCLPFPELVSAVRFSPDGKLIASGGIWEKNGRDFVGGVRVWRLDDGREVLSSQIRKPVTAVAFSPDSRLLVVGTKDQLVVIDVRTNKIKRQIAAHRSTVLAVEFSAGASCITSGLDHLDGEVKIWKNSCVID